MELLDNAGRERHSGGAGINSSEHGLVTESLPFRVILGRGLVCEELQKAFGRGDYAFDMVGRLCALNNGTLAQCHERLGSLLREKVPGAR